MTLNPLLVEGAAAAKGGSFKSWRLGQICVGANKQLHVATVWVSQHLECPSPCILRVQNSVYCWLGGACWAAEQSGAQGPVMCGAGLRVRAWYGGVGGRVSQSGVGQGAWIVKTGRCGCLRWVERWWLLTQWR